MLFEKTKVGWLIGNAQGELGKLRNGRRTVKVLMVMRVRREPLEGNSSSLYTLQNDGSSCEYSAICCVTPHQRLFREYPQVVRAMTFHEDVDGERVQEMTRRLSPVVENPL